MAKDDKLQDLSARIDKAKGVEADKTASNHTDNQQGIAFGLRLGVELVVALLVGFAMGYFLDEWLGTRPFLMILFGFLGMGAGISNIFRLFNKMDMSVGYGQKNKDEKKR